MKYLKTFENFDLGRFSEEEVLKPEVEQSYEEEECAPCSDEEKQEEDEFTFYSEEDEDEDEAKEEEVHRIRRWGDEVVEKKKVNAGFQAYLDKQKAKKGDKKEEKGGKKAKPDFLDLDKDGDKKEPMKKAAKDAKEDDKGGKKGLTAGQKKLPEAMQKAILKKQK
jgi:hypothetical protein